MTTIIYRLYSITDDELSYVGKTSNLEKRFRKHYIDYYMYNSNKTNSKCGSFKVLSCGRDKVRIETLEEVNDEDARECEKKWIHQLGYCNIHHNIRLIKQREIRRKEKMKEYQMNNKEKLKEYYRDYHRNIYRKTDKYREYIKKYTDNKLLHNRCLKYIRTYLFRD